jgi:hypothetical protein
LDWIGLDCIGVLARDQSTCVLMPHEQAIFWNISYFNGLDENMVSPFRGNNLVHKVPRNSHGTILARKTICPPPKSSMMTNVLPPFLSDHTRRSYQMCPSPASMVILSQSFAHMTMVLLHLAFWNIFHTLLLQWFIGTFEVMFHHFAWFCRVHDDWLLSMAVTHSVFGLLILQVQNLCHREI